MGEKNSNIENALDILKSQSMGKSSTNDLSVEIESEKEKRQREQADKSKGNIEEKIDGVSDVDTSSNLNISLTSNTSKILS